jgi:hypothetical protein
MLVQYSETDGVVRSNRLGLANIELLPLGEPDSVEIVCGEHAPVQGWLAIGGKLVPAPTAIYRLGGELPLSLGTIAVPFKSGVSSGLSVQPLETGGKREGPARLETAIADAAGHRFEVAFTDKVQEMACGSREAKGAVAGRAQGLVVHRGQQGRIRYIAGLNCQQLSLDGAALAAYEAPRPLVEVEIR